MCEVWVLCFECWAVWHACVVLMLQERVWAWWSIQNPSLTPGLSTRTRKTCSFQYVHVSQLWLTCRSWNVWCQGVRMQRIKDIRLIVWTLCICMSCCVFVCVCTCVLMSAGWDGGREIIKLFMFCTHARTFGCSNPVLGTWLLNACWTLELFKVHNCLHSVTRVL